MKIKAIKRIMIVAGVALAFMAGRHSVGDSLFWQGYDTAMSHVRSTIQTKMPALAPFYMSDLGIQFIPRGNSIAAIKYVSGTGESEMQRSGETAKRRNGETENRRESTFAPSPHRPIAPSPHRPIAPSQLEVSCR